MWSLKSVKGENICAFRKFEYVPAQGVATLVFGQNLDDDSQDSNGSGKSAIVESIAISILGTPLRKAKMEEIINDHENTAWITLVLENPVLKQTLEITRTLDRKADQKVSVKLDGEDVVMPNVAEYNRYILESIGLNRDQILSTFILCANHFHSFLDASDREKKDIINRFSNGVMVDQSIKEVQHDLVYANNEKVEVEKEHAARNARVVTLREEIENFWGQAEYREQRRKEMIEAHKEAIANERQKIRDSNELIEEYNEGLDRLDEAGDKIDAIENSLGEIDEINKQIREILAEYGVKTISSKYLDEYLSAQIMLKDNEDKLDKLHKEMKALSASVNEAKAKYEEAQEDYKLVVEKAEFDKKNFSEKQIEFAGKLRKFKVALQEHKDLTGRIERDIFLIRNKLAGAITCPSCHHKFVLQTNKSYAELEADEKRLMKELDINEASIEIDKKKINDADKKLDEIDVIIREITSRVNNAKAGLNTLETTFKMASNNFGACNHSEARYKQTISSTRKTITGLKTKMFDEAFKRIDEEADYIEDVIKAEQKKIAIAEGNIKAYEEAIQNLVNTKGDEGLADMKGRLAQAEKAVEETSTVLQKATAKVERLKTQENRFLQFKTHLANAKIDALSYETNSFLEHIGSSLRIRFSGFTVLKTGKVRDKISISMERNGIDCGSFGKLSVGEKSRGILANVLAMHKLCNANCPEGRGLNFLVLDEILDSTDETGIARTADVLSDLGLTSIVITHIAVADSYPHRLVVTKQNGYSSIKQL